MNNVLRKFVCSLFCLLASIILEPRLLYGQVNGNATISSTVFGQPLTITTKTEFAGAVTSLYWNGKEFVDTFDHGREFQTAASFFKRYECYNPNEAGSAYDGPGSSSSQLLWLNASNNTLESQTLLAFFRLYNDGDAACGDRSQWQPAPPISGQPSNYQVHKKVTIGFAGIENVIEYLTDLWIPEYVTNGQVQSLDAIMPYEFVQLYNYDVVSKTYRRVSASGGEDEFVKVRVADDGHALGFYSPELLQPYDGTGFRWSSGTAFGGYATMGGLLRFPVFNGPGYLNYRSYLVIGSKVQVKAGLDSLHYQFRALDPDVFNWRYYVATNPDIYPGQPQADGHWVNNGISEGRNGSKSFSPSQYLQLNPDVANAYGATNYQGAIDHYIAWGRNEGRSTVAKAACGTYHMLGFTNRLAKSSGFNGYGQLGNGTLTNGLSPSEISSLNYTFTEIAAGSYNSLCVKADGTLWMWGANQWGARGDGSVGGSITNPVQVPLPGSMMTPTRGGRHAVAIGFDATAAVDTEGYVWTWGGNWNGELGDGTTIARYTPARVKRSSAADDYLTGIVSVAASSSGMMAAIDADETVWTWGRGANGALGNKATQDSPYPVQVVTAECKKDDNGVTITPCVPVPLAGVVQVACGGSGFCLVLGRDGTVYGWGSNSNSQLGTPAGGFSTVATFIAVPSSDVIAAGTYHGIAHSKNGNVYGWGYNNSGQLGNGSTSAAQSPPVPMTATTGMDDVIDLAAGGYFSVIINSGRKVFVTGDNQYGQLGIGNQTTQYVPTLSSF